MTILVHVSTAKQVDSVAESIKRFLEHDGGTVVIEWMEASAYAHKERTLDQMVVSAIGFPLLIPYKGMPEGTSIILTRSGLRLCAVKDEGKIKIFLILEEE